MKKTSENVTNNEFKLIGKKFKFCINNDTECEKTDKACQAFIKWLATPQNSRKYIDRYGIIAGGWCVDLSDVISFNHVATAQDALTGGEVDVIYLTFTNSLLNRFVYLDSEIRKRGTILLPIDDRIEYVPFGFKYTTARKQTTKKSTPKTSTANTKTDTKKTENKTPKTNTKTNSTKTNTTATTKKTKTATKTDTTKAEKVIK